MNTLLVADFDIIWQMPMGIRANLITSAAVGHVKCKLCPKTFPVICQFLFIDRAVVVSMVEEVDESFTLVHLDICANQIVCAAHHFRHNAILLPEEATC